jgi:ribosome-associated protein
MRRMATPRALRSVARGASAPSVAPFPLIFASCRSFAAATEPSWVTGDSKGKKTTPKRDQNRAIKSADRREARRTPASASPSFDHQSKAARALRRSGDLDIAAQFGLDDDQVRDLAETLQGVKRFERDRMKALQAARAAAENSASAESLSTDAIPGELDDWDDSEGEGGDSDGGSEGTDNEAEFDLSSLGNVVTSDAELEALLEGTPEGEEVNVLDLSQLPPELAEAIRSGGGTVVPIAGSALGDTPIDADEFVPSLEELMAAERVKRDPGDLSEPLLAAEILPVLEEAGAIGVVVLDVRDRCTFVKEMVFLEGRSRLHMLSLCERVLDSFGHRIKAQHPELPCNIEGHNCDDWMLVDAGDVIVHVLSRDGREYWELEKLWREKPVLDAEDGDNDSGGGNMSGVEMGLEGIDDADTAESVRFSQLGRKAQRRQRRKSGAKRDKSRPGLTQEDREDFGLDEPVQGFYESEDESADIPEGFYRR